MENNIVSISQIKNIVDNSNMSLTEIYLLLTTKYPNLEDDIKLLFMVEYKVNPKTYTLQENRDYQQQLRNNAIRKYNGKCIISGKSDLLLLETAHIKQVFECNDYEKKDDNNILLLWLDIHKYFDNYLLSINPDTLKVEIGNSVSKDNNMYKYNGKYIGNIDLGIETVKYLEHHYKVFNLKNK